MPGDDQPPNLRRLAAFTLLTMGAMWIASAAWLLSGNRHILADSDTVADVTASATPVQPQGAPATTPGDPAEEALAPIGGSDEPVSVPTQLAATSSPEAFARSVAQQLWAGDPESDAVGFRLLDRTDPNLTDTELDEVSATVDAILALRIKSNIAAVNVTESTGLDDAVSVSVTGSTADARLTLRVRCTADCALVGVAA